MKAKEYYESALSLYRRLKHVVGEANCHKGLADLARCRKDYQSSFGWGPPIATIALVISLWRKAMSLQQKLTTLKRNGYIVG